jgi:hypothetical protein
MQVFKTKDANGSFIWACKANYFSHINEAIASIAGTAIDRVLQEESILKK